MKKFVFTFFAFAVSIAVLAHEFWLQPQKFIFTKGEIANISFSIGENFAGENWSGGKKRIQKLIHYSPLGRQSDIAMFLSDKGGDSLPLPLMEDGTHMIIFNSINSFINLEAVKFNEYLKEDGLSNAAAYRKEHNEEQLNGKEYYQRCSKTFLQVGRNTTNEILAKTALPLDIVPSKNIYKAEEKKSMKFTIYFNQYPLRNTAVKIWHRDITNNLVTKEINTNNKGQISADISSPGKWMISCVYMERNTADTIADWQSYWGSVTFGY